MFNNLKRQQTHGGPAKQVMCFAFYSYMILAAMSLNLPLVWVVRCKKCGCTITCRAVDAQTEHSQPDKIEPPPRESLIVACSCCWTAFRYSPTDIFKGPPAPGSHCFDQGKASSTNNAPNNAHNNKDERKLNAGLLIAASLIAAVRLNREEIKPSPAVHAKIADSIRLAEMIQARLRG